MGNFYEDNDDLRFYLERGIDWAPLVKLTEYGFRAENGHATVEEAVGFYSELLNLVGTFTADEIAPHAARIDREHPTVVDGEVVLPEIQQRIFAQIKDLELHGMCLPRELGGMNVPFLVFAINTEIMARADVSVCAHHGFHGGMALAALVYSVNEGTTTYQTDPPRITGTRFAEAVADLISGEACGCMDITEPGAGSDMAALRTRGEQDADGNWFVTGQKIFITSGQGKWHFVIARTEATQADAADPMGGLDALSLFLVKTYDVTADGTIVRTHTTIDGLEDKLGHHGSATVAISFERAPAWLIGARGEGFKHMLTLMNNARVGVGFESLGLAEAACRAAKAYAAERPSMGKTIDQHEMIADYLDEMGNDIRAIRALAMYAGWHEEMNQKLKLALRIDPPRDPAARTELERLQQRCARRARRVTPLLKYTASEKAVEISRRAIQIHGGSGYMTEYGVEKLLRDAVVMPIYEGTSQIQALMAMKDTLLEVVRHPQRFVRRQGQVRWARLRGAPLARRVAGIELVELQTLQFLLSRLTRDKLREVRHKPLSQWSGALTELDPKRDFALAMLHAERLCRILSDVAIAKVLLEQVERFPDRAPILEGWLERAEPRVRFLHDEITTTGARLLRRLHRAEHLEEDAGVEADDERRPAEAAK